MTRPETVEALARVVWDGFRASPFVEITPRDAQSVAYTVLDAINAGQVPGLVTSERLAVAWDEGKATGFSRAMRYMSDEPGVDTNPPNPYRHEGGGCDE